MINPTLYPATQHHNTSEFSLYVLAHCIRRPSLFHRLGGLITEDDFPDANHRIVWRETCRCHTEFDQLADREYLTLKLYLSPLLPAMGRRGISELLDQVFALPLTTDEKFLPQISSWLELFRRERYLQSLSLSTPTTVIIDDLHNIRSNINLLGEKTFLDPFAQLTGLMRMDVVPLGISGFDRRIICGGVPKKRAVLLLSGTSGGKTTFLTNIAVNAARLRLNSLFFTLEDPEEELATRFYACATQIPHRRLLFSDNRTAEDTDKIRKLQKDFVHFIHIYDAEKNVEHAGGTYTGFSVDNMEQVIEDFVRSGRKLDLILVDYFNLISGDATLSDSERAKDITSSLKRLARKYNSVIVVTAQTNRSGLLKSVVGIEDMAGFFSASWGFDYVMGFGEAEEERLQREAMVNFDHHLPETPKKLLVNIAKGKMMAKQKFHVLADFAYMTIKDLEHESPESY